VKGEQAHVKDKNHRGIVRRTSQSPSCVARPENPFITHPILLPCLIVGIPASAQIFSASNTTDSFHPMSHDRHLCSSGENKGMNQPFNRKTLGTILGKPLCGMFRTPSPRQFVEARLHVARLGLTLGMSPTPREFGRTACQVLSTRPADERKRSLHQGSLWKLLGYAT
jgi:hypothetical protein